MGDGPPERGPELGRQIPQGALVQLHGSRQPFSAEKQLRING